MSQGNRTFDPEAVDEFVFFLQEEITRVQGVADSHFKGEGSLKRMPAFGIGGNADNLGIKYTQLHAGAWGDIQDLLSSYQGFIDALEEIKEANADTEDANVADFEGQL
jgi:hypothetical protein